MSGFVLVRRTEDSKEDSIELPTEDDGSLLLSVLQSQFEGASGLRYRNPNTGSWRAIKLSDGVLKAPTPAGWGEHTYYVVIGGGKEIVPSATTTTDPSVNSGYYAAMVNPNVAVGYSSDGSKRMKLETAEQPPSYQGQLTQHYVQPVQFQAPQSTKDLIVLGLEWSVTNEDLKVYFEKFGELDHAEVKKDYDSGKSRGFGFIRFKDTEVNQRVCDLSHSIKGRKVEVKLPNAHRTHPRKIFVGCLPLKPQVEKEELEAHFSEFGQLEDVYIPDPYRGFGFITYKDPLIAQRVMTLQHTLRKSHLNLSMADPKKGEKAHSQPHTPQPQYQQEYNYQAQYYQQYQPTSFQGQATYDVYAAGAQNQQARVNYDRGFMDGRAHAQYSQAQVQHRPGSQPPSHHTTGAFAHSRQQEPVASFPTSAHPSRAPGHEFSKSGWGNY